jgi:hypothetical protein
MFKPPKRSKQFEYKNCKYYFQLDSELYDLAIDVFYEFPDHQPWKHLGVCSELEISRKEYPTEYYTNQFMSALSKSDPSQTIDEFLIACHKGAMAIIDKIEEFTQKMDMDFHLFAAKISDTDVKK